MSKRKPITQTLNVTSDDMTFEDQDGVQDEIGALEIEKADSTRSQSRFGRAKKIKSIYDPSEHNGPVHRRKKEALALEVAEKEKKSMTKTPTKKQSPVKRPASDAVATAPKVKAVQPKKTPADVVKRLNLDEPAAKPAPVPVKARKFPIFPEVPQVKQPSKRIQQRKLMKTNEPDEIPVVKTRPRSRSASLLLGTSSVSSTYDEASTVSLRDGDIPDVRSWNNLQVADYFCNVLKFSKEDASVFKNEEIDGEALMIMKRSDMVTTKFANLKIGTSLKMWIQILKLQTGSNDPTQAWK